MMEVQEIFSKIKMCDMPHPTYWGNAIAGEVGELCNLIKKVERDGFPPYDGFFQDLDSELADVFIYLVLIARFFNSDLERAILDKIKEVNERDYMNDGK